jgi:ABC-type glycerol-3-phosphate transport system permease component
MSASKTAVRVEEPERIIDQVKKRPPRPHVSKRFIPYLFIAPAVVFEFFIHILPMLIGIALSLVGLTLFYIHYWTQAPFVGLQNYKIALNFGGAAGSALLHSFWITIGYTLLVVGGSWLLGMVAALLLNGEFRGRGVFRTLFLIPYALPAYIVVITWSFMLQKDNGAINALLSALHVANPPFWLVGTAAFWNIQQAIGVQLYGSYLGLIITYLTFSLPVAIWMLAGYFDSLPKGFEEAAGIDGASALGILVCIIIPISLPGIVAVAIYCFMTAWNELLFASILTTDTTRTLAVGLQGYATQSNVYWNQLMAASIVVSIPVVIAFLALQKYMVQGLTAGG